MSPSPYEVLVETVARVEDTGRPATPRELAESLDASESTLREPIASLREYELLKATGRGYRPTVTAHELLELDVELDDVFVLDLVDE